MIQKFFQLFFLIILASCSSVQFDSPMPGDQKPLDKFGAELVGKYYYSDSIYGANTNDPAYNARYFTNEVSKHDSITLISGEISIAEKYVLYTLEIASYYELTKFNAARLSKKHKADVKEVVGKHIVFREKNNDTLININRGDKLLFADGKYYFNHFLAEKKWDVFQFEQKKDGHFSFNMIDEKETSLLVDTTSKEWNPISPVAHISNKKFKKFVANGGFKTRYGLTKQP
ncbi:MAG: hypothetical protein ABIP51_13945 [Bacteroidia bacterium]